MKITLHGKTHSVFEMDIDTDEPRSFAIYGLRSDGCNCIHADIHYIPEIIDMLTQGLKLLEIYNPKGPVKPD